ncbi:MULTISPECIES: lipopolysaccharide transport periplasmic protein LptA [Salinicola]|jgi:lipopolysaccharide export system protein LptA|uniref:lipopolysaccharide transport periplasmic protein LptA n=1 Tax=Salinicola TaxID=404432 RepID=UPI0026F22FCA|nr:lipopolysaccharide transport periplasmic protein LptA [Salinicola salarius]MEC8918194.1 lipopolysaccharide transport periplasmic protein LptA [Pseudomonadota bacterium]MED5500083.1 lipopolysaccharide transport periplasmic protein LptA [Pseudomonadota bacterium]
MRRELGQLLVLTALGFTSLPTMALESDASSPIEIAADQFELDDRQGTAVYTGNVDMQQGSMKLKAARVDIQRGNNGEVNQVTAKGGGGERAYLEQKPAPDEEIVKGWGDTVVYHAAERRVELVGNAELHQAGDTFDGAYVEYYLDSRRVQARSSQDGDGSGDGRVRMTLTPRNASEQSSQ